MGRTSVSQKINIKSLNRQTWIAAIIGAIIGAMIMLLIGQFPIRETWQGVYYPNGCLACDEDYIFSPVFKTKEECLNWANRIKTRRNNESDLYECGKNCKWKDELMVCKETID